MPPPTAPSGPAWDRSDRAAVRRGLLIYNPKAGRRQARRLLAKLPGVLYESGFAVEPVATAGPGHASEIAREAVRQGTAEIVFALGGDGTLRETAKGLLGSPVILGALPAGTANVLARTLGVPRDPLAAARAAAGLAVRTMDVGRCAGEPFLMMTSCGLDARALAVQSGPLKAVFGRAAVLLRGVAEWWRYPYPSLELEADGRACRGSFVAVCNIPHYAGPFRLTPAARCDDRRLDLALFHGSGRWPTLRLALDVILARHTGRTDLELSPVREVRLVGPAQLDLQVDGDPLVAPAPVTITLAGERLRVLAAPASPLAELPS